MAKVANQLNEENQVMKELIIQLIKENQKIKTENRLLLKNIKKRKKEQKLDPKLEGLFDQLKILRENERMAKVANQLNEENQGRKE